MTKIRNEIEFIFYIITYNWILYAYNKRIIIIYIERMFTKTKITLNQLKRKLRRNKKFRSISLFINQSEES